MSDIVLLTGVTGYLGGHIALELLKAGYNVRGSLRNPGLHGERAEAVRKTLDEQGADVSGLEIVTLDLIRDEGWAEVAKGARYVMHVASPFVTTMPKNPQEIIGPAVQGTERAFGAARRAGAERIVVTSSTVAITNGRGAGRPDRLGPDDWAKPEEGRLHTYGISKVLAERRAWALAEEGPELSVINPGFMAGPLLDSDPGTSGAVLLRLLRGELPMVPKLYFHCVDVRDVARVHVAALKAPESVGRRHPCAFSILSLKEISMIFAESFPAYAKKLPKRELPNWVTRLVGLVDGDVKANVSELGYAPELDASYARSLLGREPVPIRDTLTEMTKSFEKAGLI